MAEFSEGRDRSAASAMAALPPPSAASAMAALPPPSAAEDLAGPPSAAPNGRAVRAAPASSSESSSLMKGTKDTRVPSAAATRIAEFSEGRREALTDAGGLGAAEDLVVAAPSPASSVMKGANEVHVPSAAATRMAELTPPRSASESPSPPPMPLAAAGALLLPPTVEGPPAAAAALE